MADRRGSVPRACGGTVRRLPAVGRSAIDEQGDDHLLERPRDAGRDPRGRSRQRDLRRAGAAARRRRQHLQGAGVESSARDAVGVRRHRARAGRVPVRLRRRERGVREARSRRGGRGEEGRGREGRARGAEDRGSAAGGAGGARAGGEGAARHQGRAADLTCIARGPFPRVHADSRSHRRVAEDRIARRARAPARDRARVPRAAGIHRRDHHPHGRVRPVERGHPRRPRLLQPHLDGGAEEDRRARARRQSSTARTASWPSCCAIC